MLTRKKILHLALALSKAGDIDILQERSLLTGQGLSADNRATIREIGQVVHSLCQGYSYLRSAAFGREIAAKSAAVIEMKTKMESDPLRRKERLDGLCAGIRNVSSDMQALQSLVREEQAALVVKLNELLNALTIPEE